eukprot:CAMPEP_0114557740 /NCGR_PEP_ID=MMETSP0114-20121206/9996_1 /TAXON_ID=31324 /ORGANISM="Goniomonas sp, Strain m" /LENGTH=236 /DNA_ID=CAMNT_0001743057 /DNA_START=15 /DNA_END=725 /DNA_ORIENTATION=-
MQRAPGRVDDMSTDIAGEYGADAGENEWGNEEAGGDKAQEPVWDKMSDKNPKADAFMDMHQEMDEDEPEIFHTVVPKYRIDGAPPGHLYRELTAEINPDVPLLDDWAENMPICSSENPLQRAVSLFFRLFSRFIYFFALLFNEIIRFLGYLTYYFIVKPLQSLTELVLKPLFDSLYYLLTPIITFASALMLPFFRMFHAFMASCTTCWSTVAAARAQPMQSHMDMGMADEEAGEDD